MILYKIRMLKINRINHINQIFKMKVMYYKAKMIMKILISNLIDIVPDSKNI